MLKASKSELNSKVLDFEKHKKLDDDEIKTLKARTSGLDNKEYINGFKNVLFIKKK